MSSLPSTESPMVAMIATALHIAETVAEGQGQDTFEAKMHRFLAAYKAIKGVTEAAHNGSTNINVQTLIAQVRQDMDIS